MLVEIAFALSGTSTVAIHNFITRRPTLSRLPMYAAFTAGGWMVGSLVRNFREQHIVKREALIWDYVNKHPEDFPELTNPVKFKDVLQPWTPIR